MNKLLMLVSLTALGLPTQAGCGEQFEGDTQ